MSYYGEKDINLDGNIDVDITWLSHAWDDTVFYDPIYGWDAGTYHNFDTQEIESAVTVSSGWGGITAWQRMGRYLNPQGDSQREVRVMFVGDVMGTVYAFSSSSASAKVTANLKNLTTNSLISETIWEGSASAAGATGTGSTGQEVDYYEPIYTVLDPDDKYLAYTEVKTKVDVQGSALATADFGRGDNDHNGEGVRTDRIEIIDQEDSSWP